MIIFLFKNEGGGNGVPINMTKATDKQILYRTMADIENDHLTDTQKFDIPGSSLCDSRGCSNNMSPNMSLQ